MSLETDFNVSPYFDDFDEEKNFHRILFKPSLAVQARELTQLQTILQDQIARFGVNVLKEGTIIKGGNFVEEAPLPYVKIADNDTSNDTVNVLLYEGFYAVGTVTGIRAYIVKTSAGLETQSPDLNTLFVRYLTTSPSGAKTFSQNENLEIQEEDGTVINTVTVAGASFGSIGNGYGVRCGDGIIFHKGHFIRFEDDLTIVSKYSTTPDDVVVGFKTVESIVTSDADSSILDNANGFNNFNAPGADRINLTPILTALTTAESEADTNFFALQEYQNGSVIRRKLSSQYNEIEKYIEKRTAESDGNFTIKRFPLNIEDTKKVDSTNLACVIGPGIAYVEGKRVEIIDNYSIDFERGTDTDTVENQDIVANYGHYVLVDNFAGIFDHKINASVDLKNSGATTIGSANVRSVVRENATQFRIYLFNISMTSGNSFEDVASLDYNTGAGTAEVVLDSANNATISDFSFKRTVFPVGREAIKSFDLTGADYNFRTVDDTRTISVSGGIGTLQISLSGDDTWPYSIGALNEDEKKDFIVVADGTVSPYSPGDLIDVLGSNATINIDSTTQATITYDANTSPASNLDAVVYYKAKKTANAVNVKELDTVYVKIDADSHPNGNTGIYSLGVPDAYTIEGIWQGSANSYSEDDTVVTSQFDLFTNQRDTFYNLSYISKKRGFDITSGAQFLVKVKVFRQTNADNTFFTVDSYPVDDATEPLPANKIRTEDIPIYADESGQEIYLRDSVDFRPHAANTAVYAATIETATENPTETVGFGSSELHFIAPNESLEITYSFYLGRVDRLIIDERGEFNIIKGRSATNPVAPEESSKSLSLGTITVNPFPSLPVGEANIKNRPSYAVYMNRINSRGYTKKDIEKLESRISNLEKYTLLSRLERSAADLSIKDTDGTERFKSAILVDNFDNLSIADIESNEYSAALDTSYKEIAPSFRSYPLDLVVVASNTVTSTSNVTTLQSTSEKFIDQTRATRTRTITLNSWRYNGSARIYPNTDTIADVKTPPNINFSQNENNALVRYSEKLNQFIPLQTVSSENIQSNAPNLITILGNKDVTARITSDIINNVVRDLEIGGKQNEEPLGDFVTNAKFTPYIKSREISVTISGLRPNTKFYFYFDRVDVNAHVAAARFVGGEVIREEEFGTNGYIESDSDGKLYAIFRIPEETFFVGTRKLEIFDQSTYSGITTATSYANATYHSFNVSKRSSNLTASTRIPDNNFSSGLSRGTGNIYGDNQYLLPLTIRNRYFDPLSQTFIIDPDESADTHVHINRIDLYFATKSTTNGCRVEIREVENGYPTGDLIPFSSVYLSSDDISVDADDAATATAVNFEYPIALKIGQEYAITILPDANDPSYSIWTSRNGEPDVVDNTIIFEDTNAGTLYTSSNTKAWSGYKDESLKFAVYKSSFTSLSGTVTLTNRDTEFLEVTEPSAFDFVENEYVYIDGSNLSGTVTFVSGNTAIIGSSTLFSLEYAEGEHIVINDGSENNQVLKIASIANNIFMTTEDVPYITGSGTTHFKTVSGKVRFYNDIEPYTLVIEDSSAKTGLVFASNTTINGVESTASATISSVRDLPISYLQANIFRTNFPLTSTTLRATKLFDGTTTYDKNLNFNDNNYLPSTLSYVRSRSNEITEDLGAKSFELEVALNSQNSDVSPVIDHDISNVIIYEHLINNDSSEESTRFGNADSKYISKKVELADKIDGEDMRVILSAHRPPSTDIEVWVKFQSASDPNEFTDCSCVKWTKLEKGDGSNVFSSSANRFDYKEIEYNLGSTLSAEGGAYLNNGAFTYTGPQRYESDCVVMTEIITKDFERDKKTNALINTDVKAYNKYKESKLQSHRINNIEKEMSEMKAILGQILDRIEKNGN